MKASTLIAVLAAAVLAHGSTCIVAGDLAAVAKAGSSAAESPAAALVTGRLSASAAAPALDVRDWTRFELPGIALKSDPWKGGFFIVR